MEQMIVACAMIEKDGKYLITRKEKGHEWEDWWEFPGGKIEFGETPEECCRREIMEETGLDVEVGDLVGVTSSIYDDTHVILMGYRCKLRGGEIEYREISDHAWVVPSEMQTYKMQKADMPFIEKL